MLRARLICDEILHESLKSYSEGTKALLSHQHSRRHFIIQEARDLTIMRSCCPEWWRGRTWPGPWWARGTPWTSLSCSRYSDQGNQSESSIGIMLTFHFYKSLVDIWTKILHYKWIVKISILIQSTNKDKSVSRPNLKILAKSLKYVTRTVRRFVSFSFNQKKFGLLLI